jgi:hypothetical protein
VVFSVTGNCRNARLKSTLNHQTTKSPTRQQLLCSAMSCAAWNGTSAPFCIHFGGFLENGNQLAGQGFRFSKSAPETDATPAPSIKMESLVAE